MLRRALDAAEGAKAAAAAAEAAAAAAAAEAEVDVPDSENTSLAQDSQTASIGYGSTSLTKNQGDDDEDDDDMDSQSYDDTQSYASAEVWDERESLVQRCWAGIRECFTTIANVDDLWDDSEGVMTQQNHWVVFFWFFILALAYAGERSTFYLLVDRSGPFRLFSAEMITSTHAVMLGLGMLVSAIHRRNFHLTALGIPIVDVGCTSLSISFQCSLCCPYSPPSAL